MKMNDGFAKLVFIDAFFYFLHVLLSTDDKLMANSSLEIINF